MLYNRFIFRDVFQFHKGTIKTKEKSVTLYRQSNFNSIKVRLKLATYDCDYFTSVISIP